MTTGPETMTTWELPDGTKGTAEQAASAWRRQADENDELQAQARHALDEARDDLAREKAEHAAAQVRVAGLEAALVHVDQCCRTAEWPRVPIQAIAQDALANGTAALDQHVAKAVEAAFRRTGIPALIEARGDAKEMRALAQGPAEATTAVLARIHREAVEAERQRILGILNTPCDGKGHFAMRDIPSSGNPHTAIGCVFAGCDECGCRKIVRDLARPTDGR